VKDATLRYAYNWFDSEHTIISGSEPLPSGVVNVRYHFDFTGSQPGEGGIGRLYVNDQLVGDGTIDKTVPFVFSADETMDIGGDLALPVTDDYEEGEANAFQGRIHWVRIDLEDDDVSHLEPEETKYRRMMARQ
jgi:arylsulfatase